MDERDRTLLLADPSCSSEVITMRLIAVKHVKYNGIMREPGDEFEASDKDAQMLKGFGKARDAIEPVLTPRLGRYKRRDMTAEE